jgi:ATP-binding cassette subfamily B protein
MTLKKRRWFVPEVVQTSAMDCGPATLKCLLEGFHIPVSYGRLREACQTSVDGTSIDRLEEVANQLGLDAEQVMLPTDHLFLSETTVLPAMIVVRQPDGANHFVVVWRKHGKWLQIMDPAIGRRWVSYQFFLTEIFRHELIVSASDWSEWANSDEFLKPLNERLTLIGISKNQSTELISNARQKHAWFELAKLDASLRLVTSIIHAKGIRTGQSAFKLLKTFIHHVDEDDIFQTIPLNYWSVLPKMVENSTEKMLLLKGAVLLKINRIKTPSHDIDEESLSPELSAALSEKSVPLSQTLLNLLKHDGILSPVALIGALAIAVSAILVETLLFRGIFDIAWELKLANQRLGAILSLSGFVALLLLIEIPIAMEGLRLGRHLEIRLRIALLEKLPHLPDRYFQSRPISDMAERSHSIALTRQIPALGIQFVQTIWDIVFTLIGITLIDADSSFFAISITALAILLPFISQPLLNERDLRVRNHSGAMFSFYLDSLLGLVPIRTHSAEKSISRQHESLLVEWSRAARSFVKMSLFTGTVQNLICTSLVGLMLWQHFLKNGTVLGGDLLLIYWALKLPAIGQRLTALAQQYPAQRNVLLRLLEPLSTPTGQDFSKIEDKINETAISIDITSGKVLASGHSILENIDFHIKAGEQIAIVGSSGAGKSSLVGLLLGWYKLCEGELKIDGYLLNAERQETLRRQTAWVDPAVQIWNESFLDNLNYSSDSKNLNHLGDAIDAADLRKILQKLPEGLQTYLGESGALLSGGEGQRVRLGRALMQRNARLVLLDEPFRGLDRTQRQKLLQEARLWWKSATLICVTHDIAETLSFSRVLVIENGQIIEDGSPQELAKTNSRYQDLLHTEQEVRQQLWKGHHWRRIQIEQGKIYHV